jgi:hypothetical protein
LPAKRFTLVLLGGIGATLAVYTVLGGALLSEASDSLVGSAEAIAAGADQRTEVTHTTLVPHPAGRPMPCAHARQRLFQYRTIAQWSEDA